MRSGFVDNFKLVVLGQFLESDENKQHSFDLFFDDLSLLNYFLDLDFEVFEFGDGRSSFGEMSGGLDLSSKAR